MGSFSWLKADALGKTRNVAFGESFKFLIPEEFGGGFIVDEYQGYGYLGTKADGTPRYDMYELLAFWNCSPDHLKFDGEFNPMKQIDQHTDENRCFGIDIGCYDLDVSKLEYPLKLVSPEYNGTYESCLARSYCDPDQGFSPVPRTAADKYYDCDGELIQPGHILCSPDYMRRKVYKCVDQNGNEDLGILATNPNFLIHHQDWPVEFYSLNQIECYKHAIVGFEP